MATTEHDPRDGVPETDAVARRRTVRVFGAILAAHLAVHTLHGVAHAAIPVFLSPALTTIVVFTMYVPPIAGFTLVWRGRERLGVAVFTGSMAVAFLLAGALHFVLPSADHVASIPATTWQLPFQLTAVVIAVVDGLGVVLGVLYWRRLPTDGRDPLPNSGRIDGVTATGFDPLTRLSYWVARRWVGEVPEPLTITAHHRGILTGTNAFEAALDRAATVDEELKELAVLKAAMVAGCEFCLDIGTSLATDTGIDERKLRDLHTFEDSDAFTETERLMLRYAVAMTTTPVSVSDELFDALADSFDETELVELTAAIAYENYRARFNHAFDIEPQGFADGSFCPRPETTVGGQPHPIAGGQRVPAGDDG